MPIAIGLMKDSVLLVVEAIRAAEKLAVKPSI